MTRSTRLIIGALVIVVALAFWLFYRGGGDNVAIDLISQFPTAKIKNPNPSVFEVVDATLAGERLSAIFAKQPSRAGWTITVPDDAWLKVKLGLKEEAWSMKGDGVLFMIGVATGARFDELYPLVVNPFGNASDKGWKEVVLDLSRYAGETVDLIFNTRASADAPATAPDSNGDMPLWGAPRVVIH